MNQAIIESGFARVGAGTWLVSHCQPVAIIGNAKIHNLRGWIVPDRAAVVAVDISEVVNRQQVATGDTESGESVKVSAWFARADAPFLTRLDALPDKQLKVVSTKLLLAPFESRCGAKALKLVPFSFQKALAVTFLQMGWVVMATKSRVNRVSIEAGGTLSVRPEALVAWVGEDPTGFCPKLSVWDMLLPRGPKNLVFSFHGPAVVWFEGSCPIHRQQRSRVRMGGNV